jgi:hypothetical protein
MYRRGREPICSEMLVREGPYPPFPLSSLRGIARCLSSELARRAIRLLGLLFSQAAALLSRVAGLGSETHVNIAGQIWLIFYR